MSMDDDLNRVMDHLNSDTPRLSQLSPPGYEQTVFTVPNLPTEPFMLDDDEDGLQGPYAADEFTPEPDTNIMARHAPGEAPLYLRVLTQDGNDLTTIDGLGNEHSQRIIPSDDNELPSDDFSLTPEQARQMARAAGAET